MEDPNKTNSMEEKLPIFQALASEFRVQIMNLVLHRPGISVKEISEALATPSSTLSPHINKLADCGLIRVEETAAKHGRQKCCYPDMSQIVIDFDSKTEGMPLYQAEIPVGQYSDFDVTPTCGLATTSAFLGTLDEPGLFAHPGRAKAGILWFTTGYLEYVLPNFFPRPAKIETLSLTFEIASEAPHYNNDWPSRIVFSLNGTKLGEWISPGDYGDRPGRLNPSWWYPFLNQYGLLKTLTITTSGTYMDGELLSAVSVNELELDSRSILKFRFEVPAGTDESKGLTLFGQGFGDYNQHIKEMIQYQPS